MRDNGSTTYKTARAKRPGKMDLFMKVSIVRVLSMEMEDTFGLMAACMKVNGSITKSMVKVDTCGRTGVSILALGLKIRCTDMDNSFGLMDASTRVTLSTISSTVKAPSSGQMARSTQANGSMASSTAPAYSPQRKMALLAWVSGSTESMCVS